MRGHWVLQLPVSLLLSQEHVAIPASFPQPNSAPLCQQLLQWKPRFLVRIFGLFVIQDASCQ